MIICQQTSQFQTLLRCTDKGGKNKINIMQISAAPVVVTEFILYAKANLPCIFRREKRVHLNLDIATKESRSQTLLKIDSIHQTNVHILNKLHDKLFLAIMVVIKWHGVSQH